MNILHRAPGDAVGAAMDEAEDIAGGAHYRCLGAGRLKHLAECGELAAFIGDARAVIVGLPDGYAVHETRSRGIGPMVTRIYVLREREVGG